jgi:hypothetical protein
MKGFLLDTNIVSEYSREGTPHPGVVRWMETTPESSQYLSVLTLGEIEKGILLLDAGRRQRELKRWLENELPTRFSGRIRDIRTRPHPNPAAAEARAASSYDRFPACGNRARTGPDIRHPERPRF